MRALSFFDRLGSVCLVAGALALSLVAACTNEAGPTCATACTATQLCCDSASGDGTCVNRLIDTTNCGECGNRCLTGQACINGSCTGSATDGALPDAASMGSDAGSGMCRPTCAAGFMCCGTRCIDADGIPSGDGRADMSFSDCGVCGFACDAALTSRCGRPRGVTSGRPLCLCGDSPACGSGGSMCVSVGGTFRCINPDTDPTACGPDAVDCTLNNETCVSGECQCPAIGASCGALICGASACIDTQTDPLNCGTPSHACAAGETCTAGTCGCGTGASCPGVGLFGMCGQTCCADHCVPVDIDNCGGCGIACTGADLCQVSPLFGGAPACAPDGSGFPPLIPCDMAPRIDAGMPDAGVDAAMDVDAAVDIDAAAEPDAGVDAG